MSWKYLKKQDAKMLEGEGIMCPIDLAAFPLPDLERLFPPQGDAHFWKMLREELAANNLGFIGPILKTHLLADGDFPDYAMRVFTNEGWISLKDVARDLTRVSELSLSEQLKRRLNRYLQDCLTEEEIMEATRPDSWNGLDVDSNHPDIARLTEGGYSGIEVITTAIQKDPAKAAVVAGLIQNEEFLLALNQKLPEDCQLPSPAPSDGGSTIIADWFSKDAEVPQILAEAGITHRAQLEDLNKPDLARILSRDGKEPHQSSGRSRALRAAYKKVVGQELMLKEGPPEPKKKPGPRAKKEKVAADDQLAELIERTTALCEILEKQQRSADILDGVKTLVTDLGQALQEILNAINEKTMPPDQLQAYLRQAIRQELEWEGSIVTNLLEQVTQLTPRLTDGVPNIEEVRLTIQEELNKILSTGVWRILEVATPWVTTKAEELGSFEMALGALHERLRD